MTHLIETWGVLAVFALSVAQSLGVPTSSELTFGLVGLLWALGRMNPVAGIAAGVIGELIGAIVAWWLAAAAVESHWWARFEAHPLVAAFRGVLTSLLRRRFGVLISRLIPLERNVAAWAAGVAEVSLGALALQSVVGSAIFATAFALAGYEAKDAITTIAHRAGQIGEVVAVILVVGVVLAIRQMAHRQLGRSRAARSGHAATQPDATAPDTTAAEDRLVLQLLPSEPLSSAAYLDALGRIHQAEPPSPDVSADEGRRAPRRDLPTSGSR